MRELFASEIQAIIDKNAELKKANQELVQALRKAIDYIEMDDYFGISYVATELEVIADKWEMK